MTWLLRLATLLVFTVAVAEAQGDLSELFSIIRNEGAVRSESSQKRTVEILTSYLNGEKSLDDEWAAMNEALVDPSSVVREQACAALSVIMWLNQGKPVKLPDTTAQLVIQRLKEVNPNNREYAARILALIPGGAPNESESGLLQLARMDSAHSVRGVAIQALASVRAPSLETTEFWIQSLRDKQNTQLRGMVLSGFRFFSQSDPGVITLVIDALSDTDDFVRQEAIAAVKQAGKPAIAALPKLREISESPAIERGMRSNAEAAIRVLSSLVAEQ